MTEPQEIPRNGDDSYVVLTWAEGGNKVEPSLGKKGTGWQSGDVVDEDTINWTSYATMQFVRALVSRYPQASEALFTSWLVRNGVWANGLNPLEGFLSDAAVTDSLVADVWVNPPSIDTGAIRIQVSVAKATPWVFPASRDTYVFVPVDVTVPPTATNADLTFTSVPIGDPAPATPAGTEAVWRVETDATSIVDQEILVFTVPSFKSIGIQSMFVGSLDVLGNATVAGDLDIAGDTTIGDAGTDTLVVAATTTFLDMVTLADDLIVDGATFLNGNVDIGNAAGDAISVLGTMTVTPTATFNGAIIANGDVTLGNAVGDAIELVGSTTVSEVMSIEATTTVVGGSGGALTSDASAVLTWNGQIVANGRVSIATATLAAAGDLGQDGSDNLRWRDASGTKYVHFTTNGYVMKIGNSVSGTVLAAATTGDLSTVTITPIVAGRVKVTVTANLDFETDSTTCTILLRDVTLGTTINGGGAGVVINANYRNSATTFIRNAFEGAEYTYTLPNASSRQFAARLTAGGGDVNYVDLTVTVIGVD